MPALRASFWIKGACAWGRVKAYSCRSAWVYPSEVPVFLDIDLDLCLPKLRLSEGHEKRAWGGPGDQKSPGPPHARFSV